VRDAVGLQLGIARAAGAGAEIWAARVGEHASDLELYSREVLSAEERARLERYRSRDSAERYVVTRSLVRSVLGRRLGVPPREVDVRYTDRGKPVIADAIHFNVSHSADLIVMAVCHDRPVGIDVERRREVARVDALASRWLTSGERDDVSRIAATGLSLSEAFLRVWSLKEAKLKALGVGIAGASVAATDQVEAVPLDAVLEELPDGAGFVGAVAFA
jgi:4'-phosphopantetheinyl transferase